MVKSFQIDGKIMERALDRVGLNLNANAVPNDELPPFRPSGIRLGTPAITTRGLGTDEMKQIANWMYQVAQICIKAQTENNLDQYSKELSEIAHEVKQLARRFPLPSDQKRSRQA